MSAVCVEEDFELGKNVNRFLVGRLIVHGRSKLCFFIFNDAIRP